MYMYMTTTVSLDGFHHDPAYVPFQARIGITTATSLLIQSSSW